MKKTLTLLFLSLVLPLMAPCAPAAEVLTFRILSASGSYTGLYYDVDHNGELKSVPLTINQSFSSPRIWPVDGKLVAYRFIPPPPDAPPETPPGRKIIFEIDLSKDEVSTIVVVFPTSDAREGPLRAYLVPDVPEKHHAGMVKVINFSNLQAAVAVGGSTKKLSPGQIDVIKAGEGRVLVQVGVNKGSGWEQAFRGERLISPSLRGYVFVFNYRNDPDYGENPMPPPALTKIFFERSPDTIESP